MDLNTISSLFDLAVQAIALICPAVGIYAIVAKKAKDELLTLLDKAPVQNTSLANLAKNIGLSVAAKQVNRLIK